jgi:hypothetical protein
MCKVLLPLITIVLLGSTVCSAEGDGINIKVDDTKVLFTVSENFHGTNLCALWNDTCDSPEATKAFSQMGAKLLRFPGGCPCEWYDWKEPLATGWTPLTPEKAWKFAGAGGASMVFQTNIANDSGGKNKTTGDAYKFDSSAEHQAEWAAWALEKKVKVAFWEIGNEPEMDAPGQFKKSQADIFKWYNAKFEDQARAIKKADPAAKVMGPASTNTWFWWHENNIEKFMKAEGNKAGPGLVDAVSIHWYAEAGAGAWNQRRGTAQEWAKCMEFLRGVIDANDSRKLPLYITEWNWGAGDKNPSARYLSTALGNADCVGMFLRTGVAGHTHFCLQKVDHGWGVLGLKKDCVAESAPAPTYFALAMASRLWGKVLTVANPSDEKNVLSAYATKNENGSVDVMLINKSESQQTVNLSFQSFKPKSAEMNVYSLKGAGGKATDSSVVYNDAASPTPGKSELPGPKSMPASTLKHVLEPLSMVVLEFDPVKDDKQKLASKP